jgi:hypothetical protein
MSFLRIGVPAEISVAIGGKSGGEKERKRIFVLGFSNL